MLKFDQSLLIQVASTLEKPRGSKSAFEPTSLQRLDVPALGALHRLLLLLDAPKLIPQLSPLIKHKILIRLLHGPHAPHLWNLVRTNGPTQKIAQVANWIRQHFADEMRVDELAQYPSLDVEHSEQSRRGPCSFRRQKISRPLSSWASAIRARTVPL